MLLRQIGILKPLPLPDPVETEPTCMLRPCETCTLVKTENPELPRNPLPAYSP